MNHIYEHAASGMLLSVEYELSPTGGITLNEVRATDADYKPTGPSLLGLLHDSFNMDISTVPGTATRMLDDIAKGLPCLTN